MLIPFKELFVLIILSALAVFVVNRLVEDGTLRNIFIVVIVVLVVFALLSMFGLMGPVRFG